MEPAWSADAADDLDAAVEYKADDHGSPMVAERLFESVL